MDLPELRILAVGLLQAGLSVAVTIDALLRKRNVAAATAWIGLAWLSPLLGAALYFVLGINRVTRRAARLRRRRQSATAEHAAATPGTPLDIAISRITGRSALAGNTIEVLHNGDAAYPRMLAAIADARHSVALASYIFRDDAVGQAFIAALADAHRRGVTVRVLIDGVGGGYLRGAAWRALHRQGVPAARFLHSSLPWRTPLLNLRLHSKLLIVDGRRGFTGGINIGAENRSDAAPGERVRDTHFHLAGPVIAQAMAGFARDWHFTTDQHLRGSKWFPDIAADGPAEARVVTSGPDQELERIKTVILLAIGAATTRISVMTPYFLPDEKLSTALELAALRGVAVRVVMPAATDHVLVDWSSRAGLAPLLAAGCDIQLGDPPFKHSKLLTIDGAWSLIGSANWDTRSLRLNFETNVEIRDPVLAGELEALIVARPTTPITLADLRRRPLPVRLRDAATRLLLPYL